MEPIEVNYQLELKDIKSAYTTAKSMANEQFRHGVMYWVLFPVWVVVGFVGVYAMFSHNESIGLVFVSLIGLIILLSIVGSINQRITLNKIWKENKVW